MIKIVKKALSITLLVLLLGYSFNSFSHELQPSLLEIRQLNNEQYDVSWRVPIYYNKTHPASLQLPSHWQTIGKPSIRKLSDAHLHRRLVKVSKGDISNNIIRFNNLESTITDVFVRVYWMDGSKTSAIARPSQPWVTIVGQITSWQVFSDYVALGMDHILSGFDHLTFVLALMLIVSGWRKLLLTITAFTVAHSITLAGITLGLVWIPSPPVEAVIALSIIFLAGELVKINRGGSSLTAKYPWVVAFAFGLLHGFGFAGALNDIGLPENEIPLSLLSFNLGVELGQLLFVAIAMATIMLIKRVRFSWPQWAHQLPAYSIGSISAFWLIQRVTQF